MQGSSSTVSSAFTLTLAAAAAASIAQYTGSADHRHCNGPRLRHSARQFRRVPFQGLWQVSMGKRLQHRELQITPRARLASQ
ncbi:hypothetical protein CC80DRAFT_491138 [Byssothecium circinans]|uniref:Secreted protein n=1 Tax=Byssothecium circinans TaxID=147558 RepID=A0A6A5TY31_9PLEO|nr:hypothetical protein CC80DRAFT_491138 [Byssothecium circinans]